MSNNKNENLVKTSTGTLQGFCSDKGIGTFLGVPFAQPPIGPLRWCNALPLDETQELHDCTSFAPDPIQQNHDEASIMSQFHHSTNDGNQTSEDCLYLNIWSPKIPNEKHNDRAKLGLPVIVFLCGGGHRFGSASADVSHGEALAKRGAVVVTVPYRVGALGYLAHSDLRGPNGGSGNWALSDIITALEWVRNEISAFGGDCDCVTIMGQSAGAAHVSALMAAPRAKKLFLRAVALSGGRFNGGPLGKIDQLEVAEEKGKKIVNEFSATSALDLRDMPADTLKNISAPWNLVIDGQLLPETPDQAFAARRQPKVPLLLSFTQDDAAPFPDKNMQTIAGFKAALKAEFPDNVASSIAACYDLSSEKAAKKSAYDFVRDTRFAYQVTQFARIHRANGGSLTWMSHFKHAPKWPKDKKFSQPRPPEGYGAYHGAELWYFFDNLDRAPFPVDNEDRTLANEMASSLVTFARSGDPNYAEPGAWPPFGYGNLPRLARHFGGTGKVSGKGELENQQVLDILDAFYNSKK